MRDWPISPAGGLETALGKRPMGADDTAHAARSALAMADTGPHAALLLTEFAPTLARLLDTHALLQADLTGRNFPGPPL